MRVKIIKDEDFVNYKKAAMFIGTVTCSGKCCTEAGVPMSVCQNNELHSCDTKAIPDDEIITRYMSNNITSAIVFGGLEPLDQADEVIAFVDTLRNKYCCNDDVVIYTGYYPSEVCETIDRLSEYKNIIVKFGRYKPNHEHRFDDVLGVTLVSNNQFGSVISNNF